MARYAPLKETICFSVYNGSFLLKERPVGLKGIFLALITFNSHTLSRHPYKKLLENIEKTPSQFFIIFIPAIHI